MADEDWAVRARSLRNAINQLAQVQEFDLFDFPRTLEDIIHDAARAQEHATALLEECQRRGVEHVSVLWTSG